jgi:hypothetical protein
MTRREITAGFSRAGVIRKAEIIQHPHQPTDRVTIRHARPLLKCEKESSRPQTGFPDKLRNAANGGGFPRQIKKITPLLTPPVRVKRLTKIFNMRISSNVGPFRDFGDERAGASIKMHKGRKFVMTHARPR